MGLRPRPTSAGTFRVFPCPHKNAPPNTHVITWTLSALCIQRRYKLSFWAAASARGALAAAVRLRPPAGRAQPSPPHTKKALASKCGNSQANEPRTPRRAAQEPPRGRRLRRRPPKKPNHEKTAHQSLTPSPHPCRALRLISLQHPHNPTPPLAHRHHPRRRIGQWKIL